MVTQEEEEQQGVPQEVIEHLKLREGVRNKVYKDSLGKLTVGVGHLITPKDHEEFAPNGGLQVGDVFSDEQINKFLQEDSRKAYVAALTQAKELGKLEDKELVVVLTSVNFQLGTAWRSKFKSTWKYIKNKDYAQAIINLNRSLWNRQTPVRVKDFVEVLQRLQNEET